MPARVLESSFAKTVAARERGLHAASTPEWQDALFSSTYFASLAV
jgi:hypothetical protein